MTVQLIANQHRQVAIDMVTPIAQASTSSDEVVSGSEIDARMWKSISYTIKVATNAVTWTVFGANTLDYSDEVVVQDAASVAASASGSYAAIQAPYAYYRVKIRDTVGGSHGTATVVGLAKG